MAKSKSQTHFVCSVCGTSYGKWLGKCTGCNSWNSLVEEGLRSPSKHASRTFSNQNQSTKATPITEISPEQSKRIKTKIGEFDRVLGGGLIAGGVALLGGEPGVGKSTLLLSALSKLACSGRKVLYLSAEESMSQIRLSADRIGALDENIFLMAESDLSLALSEAQRVKPDVLVIDSVQTFYMPEIESTPGSVAQIREVAYRVIHLAKKLHIPVFLIGHITKEGNIAGPKMLEHMVDTVLYFENTRSGQYRILRSHKNRFGSTHEMGVFEMRGDGLAEVENPSALFLKERPENKPGSCVAISMEGTRPLLVEVQALTVTSPYGNPRRTTQGIDSTRCALIAAVLERRGGLNLAGHDLFVNVAGGANLSETAADLPVALAIASSLLNRALPHDLACFGELGLSGEIRSVAHVASRLSEAVQLGFKKVLLPKIMSDHMKLPENIELIFTNHIEKALEIVLNS